VHGFGDEQVARALGEDTRFAAVAVLSSERRDTIEIVPRHKPDGGQSAYRGFCSAPERQYVEDPVGRLVLVHRA
jgi:hypothetical protein